MSGPGHYRCPGPLFALKPYFLLLGLIVSTVVVLGLLCATLTGMNSPVLASLPIFWGLVPAMLLTSLPANELHGCNSCPKDLREVAVEANSDCGMWVSGTGTGRGTHVSAGRGCPPGSTGRPVA